SQRGSSGSGSGGADGTTGGVTGAGTGPGSGIAQGASVILISGAAVSCAESFASLAFKALDMVRSLPGGDAVGGGGLHAAPVRPEQHGRGQLPGLVVERVLPAVRATHDEVRDG